MRTTRSTLIIVGLILLATPLAGQGWIQPPPGRDSHVVRVRSDVRVRVTGRVAEVEVEEWFENRGRGPAEGVYVYPLPGEAVFTGYSLWQGDQELRGETMDAGRAREIYQDIVRRLRDPALIELVGHGMIRARVFPIAQGESRKITLRYTQVLDRAGQALHYRYAGPRGRDACAATLTLTADAGDYRDPFSPTHGLDVERTAETIRVRPSSDVHGDLSIFLPLAGDGVGITLAAHRPPGEDGYFMLTLSPGRSDGPATPRDITAVVDVSGSMSGAKLEQTQAALRQLLGSLGPEDRVRLVAFSNRVRASGDGWLQASRRGDLAAARRWIDGLVAEGGTDIGSALEEGLRLRSPEGRLPIVVFLTDGLPTVGETNAEAITRAAGERRARHRVFAFGVGYDVNTLLLDGLSAAGRGATEYVEPGEDVERVVSLLAAKISHPVLTDLEIAGAPARLTELYPGELPDLFAGEELVLFGRYEGHGDGTLEVEGLRAGARESFGARVSLPAATGSNEFIPRLWAARKLGELTRQVRLNGRDPELVEAIRTTALRYGLLSEYTAYLVVEPGMANPGRPVGFQAPTAASGQGAVQASERARVRRSAATAADLAAVEADAEEALNAGNAGAPVRTVAGRMFRQDEGVWMEARREGASDDLPVTEVALYSPAFFDLLDALPELRPVLEALEPVEVRGVEVAIRFADDGVQTLTSLELARLVERFRTR